MEGILLRYEEKSFVFLIAKTMGQKKRSAPLNDGNLWHHCYMHMIVAIVSGKWWTDGVRQCLVLCRSHQSQPSTQCQSQSLCQCHADTIPLNTKHNKHSMCNVNNYCLLFHGDLASLSEHDFPLSVQALSLQTNKAWEMISFQSVFETLVKVRD